MLTLITDKMVLIDFIQHFVEINGPVLIHTGIEAVAGVKLLLIKGNAVAPTLPFQPDVSINSLPNVVLQRLTDYLKDILSGIYKKKFKGRIFQPFV